MNPAYSDHQPSFELPAPQVEASATAGPKLPEVTPAAQEQVLNGGPGPASQPAVNPVLGVLPITTRTVTSPAASTPSASNFSPAIADDADVIEKDWVEKAKTIVAQTKTDPHAQNKEMSKFKADYVKKRYNKELKVSEE